MRKVTAGLFMSVDGVVETPSRWRFDSFDAEIGGAMGAMMGRVDTAVFGRIGYQDWARDWSQAPASDPFAAFINSVPKLVASRTLTGNLEWEGAQLIEGDVGEELLRLKRGNGGEIALFAGISLVRQLFLGGVLDELTLMIHPVVAGTGRRLFEPGEPTTRLRLVSAASTSAGNIIATYAVGPR